MIFLISGFFILFAARVYLDAEINLQAAFATEKEKEQKKTVIQDFKKDLERINEKLQSIQEISNRDVYLADIFKKISLFLPDGAYLTNFSFRYDVKPAKISIGGFCPTREKLLLFQKNMESDENFVKVYFPSSNWVKGTDIDFFVNFEIK